MDICKSTLLTDSITPLIPEYRRTSKPIEHVELYRDHMHIKGVREKAMYHMFTHTLSVPTKSWFRSLKLGRITSIDQLLFKFIKKFCYVSYQKKSSSKLAFIKQCET